MSGKMIDLDAITESADWAKARWDLHGIGSKKSLLAFLKENGMTVAQFKKLSAYEKNKDKISWLRNL